MRGGGRLVRQGREDFAPEGLSRELESLATHSIGNHGTETKTPAREARWRDGKETDLVATSATDGESFTNQSDALDRLNERITVILGFAVAIGASLKPRHCCCRVEPFALQ